eukprot:6490349-Amphidinium_carterae.3
MGLNSKHNNIRRGCSCLLVVCEFFSLRWSTTKGKARVIPRLRVQSSDTVSENCNSCLALVLGVLLAACCKARLAHTDTHNVEIDSGRRSMQSRFFVVVRVQEGMGQQLIHSNLCRVQCKCFPHALLTHVISASTT